MKPHPVFPLTRIGFYLIVAAVAANARYGITAVSDSAFSDWNRILPKVAFSHDEHNEAAGIIDCATCHHVYNNGRKLADEDSVGTECSGCHLAEPENGRIDLIRVFHLQCRNCHLEKKSGPIFCGQCHRGTE